MPLTSKFTARSGCFHLSSLSLLIAAALLASGCGAGGSKPPAVFLDGGNGEDSGADAAAPVDAGMDADNTSFILRGPCVAGETDVHTFVPRDAIPQPAPSLAGNGLNFDLTFAEQSGCVDSIVMQRMASRASAPATRLAIDECASVRNAISIPVDNWWLVAWLDSRNGGSQVFTSAMTETPPSQPVVRVPRTSSPAVKGSLAMITLSTPDEALLVWSESDGAGANGKIMGVRLSTTDGEPIANPFTIREDSAQVYGSLALAPIPTGGAVLGYVAGSAEVRSIFLQRLDVSGAPTGEPALLSPDGDEYATVSVAMKNETTDRGAAVYSVNPAGTRPGIRYVVLDEVGQPAGQPRTLSGPLEHANAIGITTSLSGFVIGYRAITDINWDFARIRVAFLSDVGNQAGDGVVDVAPASDFGGAPTVAMALDGRVAVSWYDDDEFGNRTLKLVSYPCNR